MTSLFQAGFELITALAQGIHRMAWAPIDWSMRRRAEMDSGQTTAEYALVIVSAATVAALVLAWATKSHAIAKLFDVVIGQVTDSVS